jgi:hypothetical protein
MIIINNIYKDRFNINKNIKRKYKTVFYFKRSLFRNIILNNNLCFYNMDKINYYMVYAKLLCLFDNKGFFQYSINNENKTIIKNNYIKV